MSLPGARGQDSNLGPTSEPVVLPTVTPLVPEQANASLPVA
jgi:hypothetical protein